MKIKPLLLFFIANLTLLFLLTGCINFNKSFPGKHYFMLTVSRKEKPSLLKSNMVLKIQTFRVFPQFEGREFIYRKSNLIYESDFYNGFFISPGLMIAEDVQKWLADSDLFKYVFLGSSPVEPTLKLEGVVSALYGDYRDTNAPKAVMKIQFFLIRNVSFRPVIVFGKTYHEKIPLKGNSPDALVAGWDQALEHILSHFEKDLKDLHLNEGQPS